VPAAHTACRASEQSSVLFQTNGAPAPPLLRIGWNRQDPRYLVTLAAHSSSALIIDVRRPTQPLALSQHTSTVNAFDLSPTNAQHICTAGDDSRALIWDLQRQPGAQGLEPALSYRAAAEVVALQWSMLSPEHIAICFANKAQVLHV
jgi:DDB1- and CUL4-associated factor 7